MSAKENVSAAYIDTQKTAHAAWPLCEARSVLISGAARDNSIGAAIAHRLAPLAAHIQFFAGDVRENVERQPWQIADTVISCHGVTHLDWLEDCPAEKAREIVEVNLLSNIAITSAFVRATLDHRHRKQLFFIGSLAHRAVLNGSAAYCASKAGLQHFARCAAWELAPKGYDVFCINPSNTEGTAMTEETIAGLMRYRGLSRPEAEQYWGAVCPKSRWLNPEDIADLVEFLFQGKGEYLSGTPLDLPGGQR